MKKKIREKKKRQQERKQNKTWVYKIAVGWEYERERKKLFLHFVTTDSLLPLICT
jgi:hypothetical protein